MRATATKILPPSAVLDTNTVLDWLLFGDAHVAPLVRAVETGAVRWLACPRMRDELQRALGYTSLAKWNPDPARVLSAFDTWTQMREAPPAPHPRLRCTDPDDQIFIDLALAQGTRWLISHDRALLRLRRRAQALGLSILPPQGWHIDGPASPSKVASANQC